MEVYKDRWSIESFLSKDEAASIKGLSLDG